MLVAYNDGFVEDGLAVELVPIPPWITLTPTIGSVPAGSSSGRKIRLRGKGFPSPKGAGDLLAEIRVVVPQELGERERELFEELARVSSFKAR